jgi:hypothetical protein
MKFHSPWIDPRIAQLPPEAVEAYLLARGWKRVGPAANSDLLLFEVAGPAGEPLTVLLPRQVTDGASLQRMIDVVADLARHEDRWAVEVLSDILRQRPASAANGPAAPAQVEPAGR